MSRHAAATSSDKGEGFTLIELLVVVSIIALLVSILMPALGRAREQAKAVVCLSLEGQMALANTLYANECDDYYVCDYPAGKAPSGTKLPWWPSNRLFLDLLAQTHDATYVTSAAGGYGWPQDYLCPAYRADIVAQSTEMTSFEHIMSYGYNRDGQCWQSKGLPEAIRRGSAGLRRASEKLMFIDANSWWTWRWGADYQGHHTGGRGWDVTGWEFFASNGIVVFPHQEGANVAFFDGHAARLPKEEVFLYDTAQGWNVYDPGDPTNDRLWRITRRQIGLSNFKEAGW